MQRSSQHVQNPCIRAADFIALVIVCMLAGCAVVSRRPTFFEAEADFSGDQPALHTVPAVASDIHGCALPPDPLYSRSVPASIVIGV